MSKYKDKDEYSQDRWNHRWVAGGGGSLLNERGLNSAR